MNVPARFERGPVAIEVALLPPSGNAGVAIPPVLMPEVIGSRSIESGNK